MESVNQHPQYHHNITHEKIKQKQKLLAISLPVKENTAQKQQTPKEFLPQGFHVSRRLPIFTRRFQRTILGTSELNFCVRNGNRWNLTVIVTDQYDWFSITFLFYFVQYFLKDVPSKLNNHCLHFIIDLRIQANCGQALDLLVHTC